MIEVKVKDIVDSVETLKELVEIDMKPKIAFQIARLAREVEKEYALFDEKRIKVIKRMAKKDENGELILDENNQFSVAPGNMKDFTEEMNELLDSKVELNADKIDLDDFECDISPQKMIRLINFIEKK